MANAISNDNFPARPVLEERKPDANPGRSPQPALDNRTRPPGDNADIGRAHQRLSQESENLREPAILSAREAKQRVAQLKGLLSEASNSAVKAHGNMNVHAFEAAMTRPSA